MKMKFMMWFGCGIGLWAALPAPARAAIFPDQEAVSNFSQEENSDAISRFGSHESTAEQEAELRSAFRSRSLPPIADSSFESAPGRVGSSAPPAPGRSPAGSVKVVTSDVGEGAEGVVKKAVRRQAVQEVALIANETGFYPSTIFLTRGIGARLFITGASKRSQCFMLEPFGVRRQVRSQKVEEVSFTPEHSGTFSFHCPMNGARGTLVVKDLEFQSRAPAASLPRVLGKASKGERLISEQDFSPEFRNH
jgi:hypothetical protein